VKIAYSLCGEGLGHCTRAIALMESLPADYTFYTYGDAYEYMSLLGYDVRNINGLSFHFDKNGNINNLKTAISGAKFLSKNRPEMSGRPDLCISDWEPTIYRFAKSINVPCISITSQHKFRFHKGIANYKMYSIGMSLLCRLFRADHYVVSSFQYGLVKQLDNVTPVYGFINSKIQEKEKDPQVLVVYSKHPRITTEIKRRFSKAYDDIRVFTGSSDFYDHLCIADRVASTSGCQLISECGHLGTPLHLFPIFKQYEQIINAIDAEKFGIAKYEKFGDKIYTKKTLPNMGKPFHLENGINKTVEIVRAFL